MLGLFGDIQQLGNSRLHAKPEFIRLDDSFHRIGCTSLGSQLPIHCLDKVQLFSLESGIADSLYVGHEALIIDAGSLEMGRQKPVTRTLGALPVIADNFGQIFREREKYSIMERPPLPIQTAFTLLT